MSTFSAAHDALTGRPGFPHDLRQQWARSIRNLTTWFVAGLLLTNVISAVSPGSVIVVGTESIPRGLYWLDMRAQELKVGAYVSFNFAPRQEWISSRYGGSAAAPKVFTKALAAQEGDTITSDANQTYSACRPSKGNATPAQIPSETARAGFDCAAIGTVRPVDSKGRKMFGWLPPNAQYTLQPGEIWVYGPHPKSLDSRYFGPISAAQVNGIATPLFLVH